MLAQVLELGGARSGLFGLIEDQRVEPGFRGDEGILGQLGMSVTRCDIRANPVDCYEGMPSNGSGTQEFDRVRKGGDYPVGPAGADAFACASRSEVFQMPTINFNIAKAAENPFAHVPRVTGGHGRHLAHADRSRSGWPSHPTSRPPRW